MNTERHEEIIKFIWGLMVRDGRKEYIIGRVKEEYSLDHETAYEFFDIASKTCREFTADGIQGNTSVYNTGRSYAHIIEESRREREKEKNRNILIFFLALFGISLLISLFSDNETYDPVEDYPYNPGYFYDDYDVKSNLLTDDKSGCDTIVPDTLSSMQPEEQPDTKESVKTDRTTNSLNGENISKINGSNINWVNNRIDNPFEKPVLNNPYKSHNIDFKNIRPDIGLQNNSIYNTVFRGIIGLLFR